MIVLSYERLLVISISHARTQSNNNNWGALGPKKKNAACICIVVVKIQRHLSWRCSIDAKFGGSLTSLIANLYRDAEHAIPLCHGLHQCIKEKTCSQGVPRDGICFIFEISFLLSHHFCF